MSSDTILVSREAPLATITLHRPDSLNAITSEMLTSLSEELEAVSTDDSVKVVILTGSGRAFSAGVDLKALQARSLEGGSVGDILDVPARRVIEQLSTMPKIVIAKVNGFCFTGALELALGCDLIVAANEAIFGDTHAKFGLRPTWGMSQRLIRVVGVARARLLSYTATNFTGAEAAVWGLAAQSAPRAELDGVVELLARTIAANSAGSLAAYKQLYHEALALPLREGLDYEATAQFPINDSDERLAQFR